MGKIQNRVAAVIDIGSSGARMLISQWNGAAVEHLDYLEQPVPLGLEVMTRGYIAVDTVRELSRILHGFCAVAQEYGVARVSAIGTTPLREAANRAYILDHLAIQNKLRVRVLEDTETGPVIFHSLRRHLPDTAGHTVMAYSGSGAIDLCLQSGPQPVLTHSMRSGLLKLGDLLQESSELTLHAAETVRDYLGTLLHKQRFLLGEQQAYLLLFGIGNAAPLLSLCGRPGGGEAVSISRKRIAEAYLRCCALSVEQIGRQHELDHGSAVDAQAALVLLQALAESSGAARVRCAEINLARASMDILLRPGSRKAYGDSLYAGALTSARELARRYGCDEAHTEYVAGAATLLFDHLRKLHGMSKKHKTLLQAACILHELGRFTNAVDQQEASFQMTLNTQLYGLLEDDSLLVANIIAPQSLLGIERGTRRSNLLQERDVLIAAKLHALLHLADALDYTHNGRAELRQIELVGAQGLRLCLHLRGRYALERLMLRQSAAMFQEIFGLELDIALEEDYQLKGNG